MTWPDLPAEGTYGEIELSFIENSPPDLWPDNQDSNFGQIRKVICDVLQECADFISILFREMFVATSERYLGLWEEEAGLPVEPSGLTVEERRAHVAAILQKGPFTRTRRQNIVVSFLQAGVGTPATFTPEGIPFATGDIGIDSYTTLMLHCDGVDASTTFPDASASAHTVTANGNAQVDTAQSKFGGASALFDGAGDYLASADSADWDFGSGDFTLDFWVRFNSLAAGMAIIGQGGGGSDRAWVVRWTTANLLSFNYATAASGGAANANNFNNAWTPSTGVWYHVAIVRHGTDLLMFVDGVQIGTTANISTDTIRGSAASLKIGVQDDNGTPFDGWLDEIRISKGIARWTTDFAPPTSEYAVGDAAGEGIALFDESDPDASLYNIVENITNFSYSVRIKNGTAVDTVALGKALTAVTPAHLSFTIDFVATP